MDDAEACHDWGNSNPAAFCNGFGFVVKTKQHTWYADGSVPHWFTRLSVPKEHYILILEAIAQILPVLVLKDHLPKQRLMIMFMDNEPSRRALVKGYGKDVNVNKSMQDAWRFFE